MSSPRPVFLQLSKMWFPVTAISSILHRISGVFLFLLLPFLLCLLEQSLKSPETFEQLQQQLSNIWVKLLFFSTFSALIYHVLAGIRHLLMDVGIGDSLGAGRFSSKLVIALSAVLIICLGVWLW